MSTRVQWRRGNTAQTATFTGAVGEITVDTDKNVVVVHDGVTAGGFPGSTITFTQASFDRANSGYNEANSAYSLAQGAFDSANNVAPQIEPAYSHANAAYNQANSGISLAQASFDAANNVMPQIQPSYNHANAAFNKANSTTNIYGDSGVEAFGLGGSFDLKGRNGISTESVTGGLRVDGSELYDRANAAFSKANTAYTAGSDAYAYASVANATANAAFDEANTTLVLTQAAFDSSNGKFSSSGGTINGDVTIDGQANVQHRLSVGTGSYTVLPNLIAQFTGTSDYYSQINQQNLSGNGSGDVVVTADNGTDSANYMDMGIGGSTYDNTTPNAFGFEQPNDGYLMMVGDVGSSVGGNLYIGTSGSGAYADISFRQGSSYDEVARFVYGQGLVIQTGTTSSSNTTGALVVDGGLGVSGSVYADAVYDSGVLLTTTISNANTSMKSYVDTANTSMKSYVDTANTSMKSYVDGQVVSIQGQISSNLAAANTYTDTANTNLKSYSDATFYTKTGGTISGDVQITGNLAVSGANVSLGSVGHVHLYGGNTGQILVTDSVGNLSFIDLPTTNTTTYTANTLTLTNGVYVSGSVTDTQTLNDGNYYAITDGSNTGPAWIITTTFNNVTAFNRLVTNIDYTAASGHTIYIQLYNINTTNWDNIGSYSGATGYAQYVFEVLDYSAYISGGSVSARLYHSNTGNTGHVTHLDYIALQLSAQGSQGPRGATGPTGATGAGVNTGGTAGQVLIKNSSTNYDTSWSNNLINAYDKANGAVQTGFTTISANGNSIASSSNTDTLTISAAVANGINVLNPTSKTIDFGLANSGVTAGTYGGSTNIPVITTDAFGRVTSAANVAVSTTINLGAGSGSGAVSGGGTLTVSGGSGITTSALGSTITITNSGVISIANAGGRVTTSSSNGAVTLDLGTTGVTAGTYTYPSIQVDAYGRTISIGNQTPVTSFNGLTGAVTLSSANVTTALGYTPANRAGDTFSGAITAPSLTSNTYVSLNGVGFATSNTFTTSSNTQVSVDSFATTVIRSAKYEVQMTSGTSYHVIELRVVHDGTTVWLNQYGEMFTGSSLGSFDASITSGTLNLLFTGTNSATTIKLIRRSIVV